MTFELGLEGFRQMEVLTFPRSWSWLCSFLEQTSEPQFSHLSNRGWLYLPLGIVM